MLFWHSVSNVFFFVYWHIELEEEEEILVVHRGEAKKQKEYMAIRKFLLWNTNSASSCDAQCDNPDHHHPDPADPWYSFLWKVYMNILELP